MAVKKPSATVHKESNGNFYQPVVFVNETIRVKFHKETRTVPIYSNNIFFDPATATKFMGIFIRQLISRGDLPSSVIREDGMMDEKKIRTGVVELALADLELAEEDL